MVTGYCVFGTVTKIGIYNLANLITRDEWLNKSKPMWLQREAYNELEGMTTWAIPWKCKAPETMWEAWGRVQDSARRISLHQQKRRIKKWNVSCPVDNNCESTSLTECTHVQLFLWNKKLERFQQKILQLIKKWSRHHRNEQDDTTWEGSRKSKKAHRHSISPDTSSHPRQVQTGELKSKIN